MNKLLISKKDWFNALSFLNSDNILISKITDSGVTVSKNYIYNYEMVMTIILNGKIKDDNVVLIFPEMFLPNNVMYEFWKKVKKLSKKHSFFITTTNLYSVILLPKSGKNGWDMQVEVPQKKDNNIIWVKHNIPSYTGKDISFVNKEIKF